MTAHLMPGEPKLMPRQGESFNGDHYICEEFLKLKEKFNIKTAIELGSCVGGTTKWLGENFDEVITIEINATFRNFCLERTKHLKNVTSLLGDTVEILPTILKHCDDHTIIFVDSHWLNHFPLLDELRIIAESGIKPVIVIHDFKVPDTDLGFDSYGGQDIDMPYIIPSLQNIYGKGKWEAHYNSIAEGAQRGVCYCYPLNP